MIPISEDELTTFVHQKLARTDFSKSVNDLIPEARRLARLMLASEQMYEALAVCKHYTSEGTTKDNTLNGMITSALSAAEGRKQ